MTVPLEIRRRVFIRGVNWVGDAVMASAALEKLRRAFVGSHITLMVRPWVAPIHENSPDIDDLWVEDDARSTASFLRAARRVRDGGFDMGIALPNSFRSALLMALGRVPHRIGYDTARRGFLLTRKVAIDPKSAKEHQVHYYLKLIDWLTEQKPEPPVVRLVPSDEARANVGAMLRERGWDDGRMRVAMAPGSINSMAKRWLPERFAAVANRLHAELGARVFLLGSKGEKADVAKVASQCGEGVVDLSGELGLADAIALTERMHAFIGNDAGAMHVAAALGLPVVAIFGPTEWWATGPFTPDAKIVRHAVECAPCMLRTCPISHPCMTGVMVEDVLRAFAELAPRVQARMEARSAIQ